ncbi:MAG: dethiobiotin synthase [Planctomycetota bacterium]|nr:dethiobiotin synthase [Planctomycetota bacterium]
MTRLDDELQGELQGLAAAGRLRRLPEAGAGLLDFTSNDYLDLAGDPRLVEAARAATLAHGAGGRVARLLGGTTSARDLERAAAEAFGSEAALLFPSGYQANLGILTSLAGPDDVLFSDRLNHASLIDGARLSRARVAVFAHNDPADLERLLVRSTDARRRLIVVEGIFSMDGDRAPLAAYIELCERHDAYLVVDEAHAVGLVGSDGRPGTGTAATLAGRPKQAARLAARLVTGGKGLGAGGALVLGSSALVGVLANRARSFIFTTAPPPALVAAFAKGIELALHERERGERTLAGARRLAAALDLPTPDGAIVPIPVGAEEAAVEAATALASAGFDLRAVRPPTVPAGTSRLRAVVRAGHTDAQLDALAAAVRGLGLPTRPATARVPGSMPTASAPGDEPSRSSAASPTDKAPPAAAPRSPVLFVAGTDTDAGKTVAAAVLVRAIALAKKGVHYWKPVQTGSDSDSDTVERLAGLEPHQVQRPAVQLELPASPHEAATAEDRTLKPATIFAALGGLRRVLSPTPLVVELAGGLQVPYTDPAPNAPPVTQLDWLADERPAFVLVARSGLGTLNHTMLSLDALATRHLRPRALVLVGEPHRSNRETLAAWSGLRVLEVPHLDPLDAGAVEALARQWFVAGHIDRLLAPRT